MLARSRLFHTMSLLSKSSDRIIETRRPCVHSCPSKAETSSSLSSSSKKVGQSTIRCQRHSSGELTVRCSLFLPLDWLRGLRLALHSDSSHDDDGVHQIRHQQPQHEERCEEEDDTDGRLAKTGIILNTANKLLLMFFGQPLIAMITSKDSSTNGSSFPTNTAVKHAQRGSR